MIKKFKDYLSLIKFSHTIFAMPFALIGFFLGLVTQPSLDSGAWLSRFIPRDEAASAGSAFIFSWSFVIVKLVLVLLCMIFARSAAMAFNRYLDREYDAKNPRTAIREIPSGTISAWSALSFTILASLLFIITCYFINRICFFLSPVALAVVLGYSYTKRFTAFCHFILGIGLALAPIGAYLAVTGVFALLPLLFSFTVIFWVSGFDIIYALQDEEFDKAEELYSMPAWLGKSGALRVSESLHVLSALCVISAGIYGHFGIWYWAGVIVFCSMLIYQHSLVKPHDLRRVNLAFMTSNGIASVVFALFVIADLLLRHRL
jgi:4-hydroxybenzoate polyprenyltransferase